ncbi:MAG: fumarate hydratase C-terminal domain-containing protein [Nitrospirae bacterium]|nr:fumarate hydratase C-terminal domain-containing protein [Nitrospirota bacterium]
MNTRDTRNTINLNTPLTKEDVLNLKIGDMVFISGRIVTGRDRVHKFLFHERPDKKEIPFDLEGGIIYHCGPIITPSLKGEEVGGGKVIAAGPTTSMRVEMYEADVIKSYGIRGIIGKGGMGDKTLAALKEYGCVYLHTISGAAAYLADRIKGVAGGWKIEEFGEPEAMWLLDVEDFPAMVTMDAHGNSLHREIERLSFERLKEMVK